MPALSALNEHAPGIAPADQRQAAEGRRAVLECDRHRSPRIQLRTTVPAIASRIGVGRSSPPVGPFRIASIPVPNIARTSSALRAGASPCRFALVDTSVHEWIHALAQCVDGAMDVDHLRGELWGDYGGESVEIQAQASAEIGECL